ncbi:MAG: L-threonylcarbamoyladenylate synthase [Burkholderiaceae bacterium]
MAVCISALDPQAAEVAASALAQGQLVGLPTETVYGLAADAANPQAIAKIFAAKGRPVDHPLIVHVAPCTSRTAWAQVLAQMCSHVPEAAWRLIDAFWPGPLTLILPRLPGVCDAAAGGQPTIGVRCPAHPVAQHILLAAAAKGVFGVAAPSANRFGRVSPTTAAHVLSEFEDVRVNGAPIQLVVVDGGACSVGIESAIVDVSQVKPALLRPGVLTQAQLELVVGQSLAQPGPQSPQVSGSLASHYAPAARVMVVTEQDLLQACARAAIPEGDAVYASQVVLNACVSPSDKQRLMPASAVDCAHELFAQLRALDATGAPSIWIQAPPAVGELATQWDGVRDRLLRASV